MWDSKHRDNLRIIPAEGFYDYEKVDETYNLQCVSYSDHNYTLRRVKLDILDFRPELYQSNSELLPMKAFRIQACISC